MSRQSLWKVWAKRWGWSRSSLLISESPRFYWHAMTLYHTDTGLAPLSLHPNCTLFATYLHPFCSQVASLFTHLDDLRSICSLRPFLSMNFRSLTEVKSQYTTRTSCEVGVFYMYQLVIQLMSSRCCYTLVTRNAGAPNKHWRMAYSFCYMQQRSMEGRSTLSDRPFFLVTRWVVGCCWPPPWFLMPGTWESSHRAVLWSLIYRLRSYCWRFGNFASWWFGFRIENF